MVSISQGSFYTLIWLVGLCLIILLKEEQRRFRQSGRVMQHILSLKKSRTKPECSDTLWFSAGHLEPQIAWRIKILTVLNCRHLQKRNTVSVIEITLASYTGLWRQIISPEEFLFPGREGICFLNATSSNKITSQASFFPKSFYTVSMLRSGDSAGVSENSPRVHWQLDGF